MGAVNQEPQLFQFGAFELDPRSGELRKHGIKLKLQPQPLQILAILLEHPGEVVTREEIQKRLWPDNTYVDFENAINSAIRKLREALADTAENPRFIETLSRRGYRFVYPISSSVRVEVRSSPPRTDDRLPLWKKRWFPATALLALLAITLIIVAVTRTPPRPSREPGGPHPAVPLTAYPGYEMQPSLSPDGSQVAFAWNGPTEDNFDIYVKLVGPGQPLRLTTNPAWEDSPAWSPDGRLIAFLRFHSPVNADLFVVPALGGAEHKVTNISLRWKGTTALDKRRDLPGNLAWTPDGRWIAFGGRPSDDQAPGIWLVAMDGTQKRRLTKMGSHDVGDWAPAFSTDGRFLAFLRERSASRSAVYVLPLSSALEPAGSPIRLTPSTAVQGLAWAPIGHDLLFSSGGHLGLSQIWRIKFTGASAEHERQAQLLSLGERATGISISKSGRLVYSAQFRNASIWKLALNGQSQQAATPFIRSTFDEETPDYSPDGKRLAFASTRSGAEEIWLSGADGSNPVQMTSMRGPQCANPRWSPDGRTILFNSRREGSADLYLLSPDTGELRRITDDPAEEVEPRWSRNGQTIYFGSNRTGRFEVWKMPAAGGAAVRVTKHGGMTASESPDGRYLYYAKHEGSPTSIWRVPVAGGEEELVVDGLSYALNFVVARRGLYFLSIGNAPYKSSIEFFAFATRKRTRVLNVGKQHWYGMALSPDQQSLLYSVVDNAGSNLMLVDNFQ